MQPVSKYPHPLAGDDPTLVAAILDDMRTERPNGTLTELLLEQTDAASAAWVRYLTANDRIEPEADRLLLASLLAAYELHRRGASWQQREGRPIDDEDQALINLVSAPYGRKKQFLVDAYGLTPPEVLAVEAYSDANKSVEVFPEHGPNRQYMGPAPSWGQYGDGWAALAMALRKIPTLGRLGLCMTTYRAPRSAETGRPAELQRLAELAVETEIALGIRVMNMRQRHYLSTAVTYNTHWDRGPEVGGLIGITGTSGCYINPFGLQGWLDGVEVLYPPMLLTVFEGMRPAGYVIDGHEYPVAHLREVAGPEQGQGRVDDSEFARSAARRPNLDQSKLQMVAMLETHEDRAAVERALEASGLADKGLMYLTYDELMTVHRLI